MRSPARISLTGPNDARWTTSRYASCLAVEILDAPRVASDAISKCCATGWAAIGGAPGARPTTAEARSRGNPVPGHRAADDAEKQCRSGAHDECTHPREDHTPPDSESRARPEGTPVHESLLGHARDLQT